MARTVTPIMADAVGGTALLRLLAALSPAFPTGGFSYSHGLERAAHDRLVVDEASLLAWLETILAHGSLWSDAVLAAAAWRAEDTELAAVVELALALAGSRERLLETTQQGDAFGRAQSETWPAPANLAPADLPYPIAVGRFAARASVPLQPFLAAYLQAALTNLVQAALRLAPIGQGAGLRVLAALEPLILETAGRASRSTLDDLGSAAVMSDIAAMRHETQYSRIFRS